MAKGRWKRGLARGIGIVAALIVVLFATADWWVPTVIRVALKTRGVKVQAVAWQTNTWRFEGVETKFGHANVRARSVTMLTPKQWKRALRRGDTNSVYLMIEGWRVIMGDPHEPSTPSTNIIAQSIGRLLNGLGNAREKCPRAVLLNGTLQTGSGEFNSASIQWVGGELVGDMTWPRLNDPAEFRLKLQATNKLQAIIKQTALEIGSRLTLEKTADGARTTGYARWKENRIDLDLNFPNDSNTPRGGFVNSKGLTLPGALIGIPQIDTLNARFRLTITNGQFDFHLGAPERQAASATDVGQ